MDSFRTPATTDSTSAKVDDLSSLAWVHEELRRSLEAAHKALRRFVKESESLSGSDVDAVDPSVLRTARQQIHQGVGALELVGMPEVASVLRASEAAVQRFVAKPAKLTAKEVEIVEQASFALLDYVQRVLAGRHLSPVSLFPQYQAVQALAGADRVHPADLWAMDWRWRELPAQDGVSALEPDAHAHTVLEQQLLVLMRGPVPAAAARMSDLCAGLGAGATTMPSATLWRLAAAFFEGLALGMLPFDVYSKRVASRLLAQLRSLERGESDVSERLAQDLLFFCAQSRTSSDGRAAPRLAAARQAYGLSRHLATDYTVTQLGRHDPAVIAQARKRVGTARDAWSAVAGGEMHRMSGLAEQFSLVGDSVKRLYPAGEWLANELQQAIVATQQSGAVPPAPLAMEVATSVLYLEASLEDADFDHVEQGVRVRRLADRIGLVRAGQTPPPLESWMEDLYRRVSDRQTMGSVVQELHTSLSEIEKQIDQFFRNPADRKVLVPVPNQLASMRGVLSVLGLDQASHAVVRMRDDVDGLLTSDDPQGDAQSETFDRLAGNVGALGFLINMLSVQPQAKSLFAFDAQTGRLNPLMGRAATLAPSVEPRLIEQAQSLAESLEDSLEKSLTGKRLEMSEVDQLSRDLDRLTQDAHIADQPALQATLEQAQTAFEQALDSGDEDELITVRGALSDALSDFVLSSTDPVGLDAEVKSTVPLSTAPASMDTDLGDDPEMREIFLEEAREVIDTGEAALAQLAKTPADIEQLTSLRRAFHTLKGSSRMVGLKEFGEAGWAAEQVFNTWLAGQNAAAPSLMNFSTQTLSYMKDWVGAIEQQRSGAYLAEPVKTAADALNAGASWAPIALPSGSPQVSGELPLMSVSFDDMPELPAVPELAADSTKPAPEAVDALPALPTIEGLELDAEAAPADALIDAKEASLSSSDFGLELDLRTLDELTAPTAGAASKDASDVADLSFNLKSFDDAGEPAVERRSADVLPFRIDPAKATATDSSVDLDLDLGEETVTPEQPLAEPLVPTPVAEASSPDSNLVVDIAIDELPADVPADVPEASDAVEPIETAEVIEAGFDAEPDDQASSDAAPFVEEEQVKVVGPLRISIPLFNIYLNEADELSRRLTTEVAEWAMELHRPVGEMPVALAHSLAGSSATVGFTDLSQLSRTVEHALMRQQSLGNGTSEDGALFVEAAEEIRRLLHQFAAGFLKGPTPELLERLAAHEASTARRLEALSHTEVPVSDTLESPLADAAAQDQDVPADAGPPLAFLPEPEPEPQAEAPAAAPQAPATRDSPAPSAPMPLGSDTNFGGLDTRVGALGQAELKEFTPLPLVEVRTPAIRADALDTEDDIDSVDAVDAELFPIFQEEAEELLPELSTRLREWAKRPSDNAPAAGCMRTLHTLKGGARLAGAMRLGEMAHRLEANIEHLLAQDIVQAHDIDALQSRADSLSATFEALRSRDAQAYAEAEAAVAKTIAETPAAPQPAPVLPPLPPIAVTTVESVAQPAAEVSKPEALPTQEPLPPSVPAERTPSALGKPVSEGPMEIDWSRFPSGPTTPVSSIDKTTSASQASVRVRGPLLERLVNHAGEVSITRSRIESEVGNIRGSLSDLTDNLERLRQQLRDIEFQAELQMSSRLEAAKAAQQIFDPLESDRFTRFQELTRMMAESVNDVATVQRTLQRTLETTEDELVAQGRLTRDMQDDLLRTRMVEFEGQADRLYRVVRQAAKETGKQVRLDILGGSIEVDRGVLDRMMPAFEHLLRNCVTHGIESPEARTAAGKDAVGTIIVAISQEGNEVGVEFRDDGAGLNLQRIRDKGVAMGLLNAGDETTDADLANLIFNAGFSTADVVTELAGRGVGMDVVRSEVNAMGGRIETATAQGKGTSFKLVLPLTTAVTQVVMLRCGNTVVAVPSTLIEIVRRATAIELEQAYETGSYTLGDRSLLFFWFGALLQLPPSAHEAGRMRSIIVVRSAQQRIALHVDEVLGNQEVVVKNLGPQLSRLPGLAGMTLLASGAVALIYNPVALATLYGENARTAMQAARVAASNNLPVPNVHNEPAVKLAPLVLVVDDSLTVRRVTQRLLVREGYRVELAKDGLEALERLAEMRPEVVLSDIEMPRMDGFDLVRNIRADVRLRDLPVIMITSRIAQKHRDYAAELGVDHYLGKPYSEDDLLALIGRYTSTEVAS
jgi:chemosensory pili system protein ChpA (sensor histidine kinase/response regulator)